MLYIWRVAGFRFLSFSSLKMKYCETLLILRWLNFCGSGIWNRNLSNQPLVVDYLEYIDWIIVRYSPALVRSICHDLIRCHIHLFGDNPISDPLFRLRMKTLKLLVKYSVSMTPILWNG